MNCLGGGCDCEGAEALCLSTLRLREGWDSGDRYVMRRWQPQAPVVVMPRAWLGLKARAWAWLGRAWAWKSSGPSPSPPTGLGLAWLGPRPGLEHHIFFSHARDCSNAECALNTLRRDGLFTRRHFLGLRIFTPVLRPGLAGLAWLTIFEALGPGPSKARRRAWLGSGLSGLGFRASGLQAKPWASLREAESRSTWQPCVTGASRAMVRALHFPLTSNIDGKPKHAGDGGTVQEVGGREIRGINLRSAEHRMSILSFRVERRDSEVSFPGRKMYFIVNIDDLDLASSRRVLNL
ncbi:hypothetical protein C8R47DRAFT_1196923 [Mycena vitilis]|nr:hypothetical protein C8R47DRAFT_1196923 [Mycena vitilis]